MRQVAKYTEAIKASVLTKALAPNAPGVIELAKEFNIPKTTIYTWLINMKNKNSKKGQAQERPDVFSRKIVGFDVFDEQSAEHASEVVSAAYRTENIGAGEVTLHADNGGPMKGSMMLATLQNLGIATSFSRPSVSNDNPYSESMFRTLKYCPQYPNKPFESTKAALEWVRTFVDWYNNVHQHSGNNFVTPNARHKQQDRAILAKKTQVYERAKQENPMRWSGKMRNWARVDEVLLNSKRSTCKAA